MPKTKQQKEAEVQKLKDGLERAKTVVFVSYDGLKVKESQKLRENLKKEGVTFFALKKSLLNKALEGSDLPVKMDELSGGLAAAFGYADEVTPARILADFMKGKENLKIRGGLLEKKYLSAQEIISLAKLPGKLEMLAKTLATMKAPVSGFVNVLAGNLRGLVNVLNALKQSKTN